MKLFLKSMAFKNMFSEVGVVVKMYPDSSSHFSQQANHLNPIHASPTHHWQGMARAKFGYEWSHTYHYLFLPELMHHPYPYLPMGTNFFIPATRRVKGVPIGKISTSAIHQHEHHIFTKKQYIIIIYK